MAEFGEFLLAQKAQEPQGSDDQTPSGRDAWSQGLLQAFKAMVKLSTGQGVRPIRATDAVPFAAGVRLSLHANTKVVQHLAETYMQASRQSRPPKTCPYPASQGTPCNPTIPLIPHPFLPRMRTCNHALRSRQLVPPPTRRTSGPTRRRGCYCSSLSTTSASSRRDISSALRMTALNPCL